MRERQERLLARLAAIGDSLRRTGQALALLGLGSVGAELDRLDDYSDLDFFAIVEPGRKAAFLQDLGWLASICPIAYRFMNTADGYKLLFEDGIFCEFAIFEPAELVGVPFAAGRVVWRRDGFDTALLQPAASPQPERHSAERLIGEAITNLYVGLGRYHRGERLSAARFIQGYAVDRIVELTPLIEAEQPAHPDPFAVERRYEQRFPHTAHLLSAFIQGYDRTPESARAILAFLERHFAVNPAIKRRIEELLAPDPDRGAPAEEREDA
jgi:lincosamide nucleotidyltransferase B/F